MTKLTALVALLGLVFTSAFAPVAFKSHSMSSVCDARCQILLRLSDKNQNEGKPSAPTSGTFYDDEVDPIPSSKKGISDSMKQRLIREASTGLDSEKKQTNVILYIIAVVAVLVVLGGQGILY